jgi:hypothetical protein
VAIPPAAGGAVGSMHESLQMPESLRPEALFCEFQKEKERGGHSFPVDRNSISEKTSIRKVLSGTTSLKAEKVSPETFAKYFEGVSDLTLALRAVKLHLRAVAK